MKTESYKAQFVELMSGEIEPGVIYISEKYGHASWICPCGCGRHSGISLRPEWENGWDMTKNGDLVTFNPSILDSGCKSHYFIRDNKIVWA